MKVHQILGLAGPKPGDVGLELEVEAKNPLPIINEKSWKTKADGSLRGFGAEYISKGPIPANKTKLERIQYLCDKINAPEIGVDAESPRTSFHVHVNVSNFTPVQVWTAATSYWLIENLLMRHCGHDREGNLFCLRLADAEAAIGAAQADLVKPDRPFKAFNDRYRYMALNLKPVREFGSIEFRGMRGATNAALLDQWSTACHELVRNSVDRYNSPAAVVDAAFRGVDLPEKLLGMDFVRTLKLNNPDWSTLIEDNIGLVAEIAYATDWDKYEKQVDEAAQKKPLYYLDGFARVENEWQRANAILGVGGLAQFAVVDDIHPPAFENDLEF